MSKRKIPSKITNKIKSLISELTNFTVKVSTLKSGSNPFIQIYEKDDFVHTLYIKEGNIHYAGLDINSGHVTEADVDANNEVNYLMYATMVMKLPLSFFGITQTLSLITEHGLQVQATMRT